jgi:hypothetical protein
VRLLKGRLNQATSNRAFTIQTALFYRSLDQLLGIGLAGTSTLAVTLTFGVALPANDIDSGAQESTWMGKVLQDRVGFGLKNLIILLATVTNMGTVGLSIMGNCLKLADKLEGYRDISVRWSGVERMIQEILAIESFKQPGRAPVPGPGPDPCLRGGSAPRRDRCVLCDLCLSLWKRN